MKHRIIICAAAALLLAPAVSHARWGTGFSALVGDTDDKEFSRNLDDARNFASANTWNMAGDISKHDVQGIASLFVEGSAPLRFGLAAGYGRLPQASSELAAQQGSSFYTEELSNKTQMFMLDAYLKYASKGGRFSVYGGGGLSHMEVSTRYGSTSNSGGVGGTFRQKKTVPQAVFGCEVFLTKWLAINAGARAVFGALFDNLKGSVMEYGVNKPDQRMIMERDPYGEYISYASGALAANQRPFEYDFGGIYANAGLRIYFK